MRLKSLFATTLGLLVVIELALPLLADDRGGEQFARLKRRIDAVANRNPEPKVVEIDSVRLALFNKRYDWGEHRRVESAILALAQEESEQWWEMLQGRFEDNRYSFSCGEQVMWIDTWSVGDICLEMAHARLLCAYLQHLEPGKTQPMGGDSTNGVPPGTTKFLPQELQLRLHKPPHLGRERVTGPTERKVFMRWCEARKGKSLYQLQMEICQWAIDTVEKDPDAATRPKEQFIQAVKRQIAVLTETKKPVIDHSCFGSPIWRGKSCPFNAEEAKGGWKRYEKLKAEGAEKQTPAASSKRLHG